MAGLACLKSLIIDSDLNRRMLLRQAATNVASFRTVQQLGSLNEATRKFSDGEAFDVIFISCRFDNEQVRPFIKQAKEMPAGADAAYVLVLETNDPGTAALATNVLTGADGFLIEPYSVDQLEEITVLAGKIKKERRASREKIAIGMIVQDIIAQVDKMSYIKACKMDPAGAQRKLQELCGMFKTMEPETLSTYYDLALEAFESAKVGSVDVGVKQYKGASSRIKKKVEEKILAKLDAQK